VVFLIFFFSFFEYFFVYSYIARDQKLLIYLFIVAYKTKGKQGNKFTILQNEAVNALEELFSNRLIKGQNLASKISPLFRIAAPLVDA
jgi:hypothetical protein